MYKNLIIALLSVSCFLFADEKVKGQIEDFLRQQNLSQGSSNTKATHANSPQGLEKLQTWTHMGAPVTEIILQETPDIKVTVYNCQPHKRYWYRLQGSILNVDLWYGFYQYSNQFNNRTFFQNQFNSTHTKQTPSLQPNQLELTTYYKTTDYGNVVVKYSHGHVYPGYQAFSYYCNRGNRYWVELQENQTQSSYWYGPYPYYFSQPKPKLKIVVALDKPQYEVNESPSIKISVHNNSSRAVWLKFTNGMRGDYILDNNYHWSKNMMFTQVLGRELVPAYGKIELFQKNHSLRRYALNPGQHRLVGVVKTRNYGTLRSNEVTFSVRRSSFPPHNSPSTKALMDKAIKLMKKGKYNIARKLLTKITQIEPSNIIAVYNLACVEAITYHEDLALDYLARAFELGYRDFAHIRQDPDLNNVRYLRRFRRLIKKYQY
ncbi:BsuPI-related putative proteinase inhibitor [Candidatus Uabimicrobium sp. HlEnr_7]|uniref:TPR end-of-group domain-containing protein n=1 Tax=Candidatus Uabimicrobium helgolandensis TaxID=3095367 RepID=UPI003556A379